MDYAKWSEEYAQTAERCRDLVNKLINRRKEAISEEAKNSINLKIKKYQNYGVLCDNISKQLLLWQSKINRSKNEYFD